MGPYTLRHYLPFGWAHIVWCAGGCYSVTSLDIFDRFVCGLVGGGIKAQTLRRQIFKKTTDFVFVSFLLTTPPSTMNTNWNDQCVRFKGINKHGLPITITTETDVRLVIRLFWWLSLMHHCRFANRTRVSTYNPNRSTLKDTNMGTGYHPHTL